MNNKNMTCILCPKGCSLKVSWDEKNNVKVEGNGCSKGKDYAIEEIVAPKRVITSTIRVINGKKKMLPIKSDKPVLKENIMKFLEIIYKTEIEAPVEIGQIIIENIDGFGANIIATGENKKNI